MAGASFSLNSDGGVVTQQSSGGGGSSNSFSGGPSGGGQSSGGVAQGGTDFNAMGRAMMQQGPLGLGINVDALNKITGGMIQGYIDRQKKEQYAQGMAMAAQGRSLVEIEKDQPWYTKLYGPDATVQGAQQMNVMSAMNDAQTQFMQAMPQLREKSPDQVRQYLVNLTAGMQATGDPATDAMIQAKLPEMYGSMLSTHMGQYMQYQQEQNAQAFNNIGVSAGKAMQTTLQSNNNLSDDDINSAHAQYLDQIAKPDNMNNEAYAKSLHDITVANAMQGNWQSVRAIQTLPAYQSMDPLVKAELDTKIPLLEAQAAAKNPNTLQLLDSREGLVFNMTRGVSPFDSTPAGHAAAMVQMQALNDKNKTFNGDATPVFTHEQMAQTLTAMDENNYRRAQLLQKAQTQQLNFNEGATLVMQAWGSGTPELLKGVPIPEGARVSQLNSVYQDAMVAGPGTPQYQSFMAHASATARDDSMHPPMLDAMIKSGAASLADGTGPATASQQNVINIAQQLRQGPGGVGAVKSYFGDMAEPVLAIMDSGVDFNNATEYDMIRQQLARGKLTSATAQDKKDALAYVQQQDPSWWKFWRTGDLANYDLSDTAKSNMAQQIAPIMAQKVAAFGLSQDDAAKAAFTQVMGNGDLVPGAYVPEDKGRWGRGEGFADYVAKSGGGSANQMTQLYQDTFKTYIGDLATKSVTLPNADMSNFNADDYHVAFGQYLGGGQMNLTLTKGDGSYLRVVADGNELGKRMLAAAPIYKHKSDAVPQGMPERNAYGWSY
jgi:hypothetical protein